MTKAVTRKPSKDAFLDKLKKAVEDVITDKNASKKDVNAAVANGAKLLQIEHKINPTETENFFD